MHRDVFHRMLSRLALVAALLLATLPTFGRLATHAHPHAHAHSASHPMSMVAGQRMPAATTGEPTPTPPPHAHGLDCVYCALLAGVVPTAGLSPVAGSPPADRRVPPPAEPLPDAGAMTHGLGARGPPRAA